MRCPMRSSSTSSEEQPEVPSSATWVLSSVLCCSGGNDVAQALGASMSRSASMVVACKFARSIICQADPGKQELRSLHQSYDLASSRILLTPP